MKNVIRALSVILLMIILGVCTNYYHELIPPDDTLILSFYVDGQLGSAEIFDNSVIATVEKGASVSSLIPQITVSQKATIIPITLDYVHAAFPNANLVDFAMKLNKSSDIFSTFKELVKSNPDFNVPALTIPIDFTGPVTMFVMGGRGSTRQYTVNVVEDSGEPRLLNIRFSKYNNPELVNDALCMVDEKNSAVYANAVYPMEMDYLSYALVPSFQILGESFKVDGNEIDSGVNAIQFSAGIGIKNKTITITRDGETKIYTLTVLFTEDKDTIRSITDFRFNKTINSGISANAVGSIINTDNTGTIIVQVFYSGAKPTVLKPSFVSPGTVSVGGVTQTSGVNSNDFLSPVEYRVLSRNGMYGRTYTVKVEFINIENNTPHITSFRFSAALNAVLVQDAVGSISGGTIFIEAYYGGSTAPTAITPEFSAEGIVSVYGSVQVSGASAQDFTRQIKYTVTNPEYPSLTLDYWIQCRMIRDISSDAAITEFAFYPEENSNLTYPVIGKIDHINGKISVYAPIGSGVTTKIMYPRFTAAGKVNVSGTPQVSGESGGMFDTPVTYTVVSANGKNTRNYVVTVRELQTTIYVNCNAYGYGDGTSWENAFRSLKDACEAAAQFPQDVPKEIWIAAGTYKQGTNASDYYLPITANTSYIGGFAGYETAKSQRNVAGNTVIISGDLGGGRRAFYLFYATNDVNGDLLFENLKLKDCSYGTSGRISNGDVEINNLDLQDISNNGIYFYGCSGSIKLSNITANNINNYAVLLGNVQNEIILKNSIFTNSGGVCFQSNNYTEISDCDFKNINKDNSSAIGFNGGNNITIDHVNIDGVVHGSGILIGYTFNTVTISNSTIKNCKAFSQGGGISLHTNGGGIAEISSTTIENVETSSDGGGIYFYGGNLTINGCTIRNAKANYGGGISSCGSSNTFINNTTIENTEARESGGAIEFNCQGLKNNNIRISDSTIRNCKAIKSGGGFYMYTYGKKEISNTIIENIETDSSNGYVISAIEGNFIINGCTINDSNNQRLIYIQSCAFQFKLNNIHNGILLNTPASINNLVTSGVIQLTSGATLEIVP
jgi:hypothetical protein